MAILTFSPTPAKNVTSTATLNKAEVYALTPISGDAFWSDPNRVKTIDIAYQSTDGGQTKILSFDAQVATPQADILFSTKARDTFQIRTIILRDYDDGELRINRATLSGLIGAQLNALDLDVASVSTTLSTSATSVILNVPIPVTVTFGSPVTGFTADDITFVQTSGYIYNFSGSGTSYTFEFFPTSVSGYIDIYIAADVTAEGNDASNTINLPAAVASKRTVSITSQLGMSSVADEPIETYVTFSSGADGFTSSDIEVTNGVISGFRPQGAFRYYKMSALDAWATSGGPVTNLLALSDVKFRWNNADQNISSFATIEYLTTPTTLYGTANLLNNSIESSNATDLVTWNTGGLWTDLFTIDLKDNYNVQAILLGPQGGSVAYYNVPKTFKVYGSADNSTWTEIVSVAQATPVWTKNVYNTFNSLYNYGIPNPYTVFTVTPQTLGQDVTIRVPADCVDGNNYPSNTLRYTYLAKTTATISPLTSLAFVNSPISFNATFGSSVTGFTADDISVIGGVASNVSGTGSSYTFDVTPNGSTNDYVTVQINKNTVTMANGARNEASNAVQLTLGSTLSKDASNSLFLLNAGSAYGIGDNSSGELGINSTANSSTTTPVVGGKLFKDIGSGSFMEAPIASGSGNTSNTSNRITNASFPITIEPGMYIGDGSGTYNLYKVVQVISSSIIVVHTNWWANFSGLGLYVYSKKSFSAGLADDGFAYAWGNNDYGQLGSSSVNSSSPVSVIGGKSFNTLSVGNSFAAGLDINGQAWTWGHALHGALGTGSANTSLVTTESVSSPVSVSGNRSFSKIRHGQMNALAIEASTGYLWSWGYNQNGQGGDGTTSDKSSPTSVLGGRSYSNIAVGQTHSIGIEGSTGYIYAWGANNVGQLGINAAGDRSSPVSVLGGRSYSHVFAGNLISYAIEGSTGRLYSWGRDFNGSAGWNTATNADRSSPISVAGGRSFNFILAGGSQSSTPGFQSFAIEGSTGYIYAWGDGSTGILGDNTTGYRSSPNAVAGNRSYSQLHYNNGTTTGPLILALEASTGFAYAWGANGSGQLGDNTGSNRSSPTSVVGGRSFSKLGTPIANSVINMAAAIEGSTGYVWTWGNNTGGQLGNNAAGNRSSPVSVAGARSFKEIQYSLNNAIVALEGSTGYAWAWGPNETGQVGDGTITNRSSPVSMLGGRSYSNIAQGYYSKVASILYNDSEAYSVGSGQNGFLGGFFIANTSSPVSVLGGRSFSKISAGGHMVAAIEASTGRAYTWGLNRDGQLGNNSEINSASPVSVAGNRSWRYISASNGTYHNQNVNALNMSSHVAAIEYSTGRAFTWGAGHAMGDNTITAKNSPTSVAGGRSYSGIAAGSGFTVALEGSTGALWSWGLVRQGYGTLGNGTTNKTSSPVSVLGGRSYSALTTFDRGIAAVEASTGDIYVIGAITGDEWVGTKHKGLYLSPEYSVSGNKSYSKAILTYDRLHAIEASTGYVWSWGVNANGQLGDGTAQTRSSPVSMLGGRSYSDITTDNGGTSSMVNLLEGSTGYIWSVGYNNGNLGDGTITNRSSPVSVAGGRSYKGINNSGQVNNTAFCAIEASTGYLWAWGNNSQGQLGDGTTAARSAPVSVAGGRSYKEVAAGFSFTYAIEASTGYLWSWGSNTNGQLADNTVSPRSAPVSVAGARSFSKLTNSAYSPNFGFAIEGATGYIYSWGQNSSGQLGINTVTNRSSPTSIVGDRSYSEVIRFSTSVLAREASTGYLWAWGNNAQGQLGDGSITNRSAPTAVAGGRSYKTIHIVGPNNFAALEGSTGHVWMWGPNNDGQLGDGTTNSRSAPTKVLGNRSYSDLVKGVNSNSIAAAIEGSTGYIYVWGSQEIANGGFGNESSMPPLSPIRLKNISEL